MAGGRPGWAGAATRGALLGLTVVAVTRSGEGLLPAAARAASPDRIDVSVSRRGFQPERIAVRKGEPVRFSLSTSDGEHCFAVDAFRVEKRVVPGRQSVVDLTPDRAGTFPFYDCLADPGGDPRPGTLVVTE